LIFYGGVNLHKFYVFPFDKIEKGSRIVIYGAGVVGFNYYLQIKAVDYCDILFVADPYYKSVDQFNSVGVKVVNPDEIKAADCDYVVIATRFMELVEDFVAFLESISYTGCVVADCSRTLESKVKGLQFARIMYAQRAEDWIVYSLFSFIGIDKPSYIDVGAHHPYELSNTALLYENGSRGINIEPNKDLIAFFNIERPDDVNICAAVGRKTDGETTNFFVLADEYNAEAPSLNTTSADVAQEFVEKGKGSRKLHIKKSIEVPLLCLEAIIAEYHNGVWPDYMSMDIEGVEYEIIEECDLTDGPIVITIEVDKLGSKRFCAMMDGKGYSIYCRTGGNITFVRKDYVDIVIHGKA